MKKLTKAVLSGTLVAGMLAAQCFSASATIRPIVTGDVDWDFKVDINDVTLLQNGLAGSEELSKYQLYAGDVNFNGVTDVEDVTLIQCNIAGKYEFSQKMTYDYTIHTKIFYANFDSGKAMAGVPVTFTGVADGGLEPFTYEFYVDGELVQPKSSSNTLTYTFDKSGRYYVEYKSYNIFNDVTERSMYYTVVDPYESDTPVICAIHTDTEYVGFDDRNLTISANVVLGTAPYQYKFTLDNGFIVQDYSENSDFFIDMQGLYDNDTPLKLGQHTVLVEVKDADGKTTAETFTFEVKEPRMG